jgi:hypothetical protein
MNLNYRINQIRNTLLSSKKTNYKWVFIYGVPRSGTTYFYHELLQLGKMGISDFDLQIFIPVISHIEESGYIPIDTDHLKEHLLNQLRTHSAPGGGSEYDFVVKQVNTNKDELDLFCDLFGTEPDSITFLYRHPSAWLSSAMRKFNISQSEAISLYKNCLNSFNTIGGKALEYGPDIVNHLTNLGVRKMYNFEDSGVEMEVPSELVELYNKFQEKHGFN